MNRILLVSAVIVIIGSTFYLYAQNKTPDSVVPEPVTQDGLKVPRQAELVLGSYDPSGGTAVFSLRAVARGCGEEPGDLEVHRSNSSRSTDIQIKGYRPLKPGQPQEVCLAVMTYAQHSFTIGDLGVNTEASINVTLGNNTTSFAIQRTVNNFSVNKRSTGNISLGTLITNAEQSDSSVVLSFYPARFAKIYPSSCATSQQKPNIHAQLAEFARSKNLQLPEALTLTTLPVQQGPCELYVLSQDEIPKEKVIGSIEKLNDDTHTTIDRPRSITIKPLVGLAGEYNR